MADLDAMEAAEWVAAEIQRLRELAFEELLKLEGQSEHQRESPGGRRH